VKKSSVLILGGRSDIGLAVAHRFAAQGHPILLAARAPDRLKADGADLALRHGVAVRLLDWDALDPEATRAMIAALDPLPGVAVCAVGVMGDQGLAQTDGAEATRILRSNFEGPALAMGWLANRCEARGSGVLVGISSVAGERGRASNYVYGAAKAGFTAFLSGLRNRLAARGVQVVTVLPGFVQTRMVEGRHLPPRLTATPQEVAQAVERAIAHRRDVVHVRAVWGVIMLAIRLIPERLFKRMRL
jgi:decaprenylphospho-beta-D-erythro-pentofuranosid-2-ulose 2-reductase